MSGTVTGDISLGRVLAGRYRLSGLIGAGGLARVYRAVDEALQRRVAVKVLHPHLTADERIVRAFKAEATLGAALAHPDVVRVYDAGLDGEPHFIVMELVPGDTLHDLLLDRTSLPPARTAEIAIGVCSALAAVHDRGVVHGDVKPANIMITESGQVKLIDLGTARAAGDASGEHELVLATRAYCSPEQLSGGPMDGRSDVYSLGLVLHRMLTGALPGRAAADGDDPGPPPRLLAVVERATAPEPAGRHQSVRELRADLTRALHGGPALQADEPHGDGCHTKPLPPRVRPPAPHQDDEPVATPTPPRRRALPLPVRLAALTALVMAAALMVVIGLTLQITRNHLEGELRQRLDVAARSFEQGPARRIDGRPDALAVEAQRWLAAQAFPDDQVVAVRTDLGEVLTTSGGLDLRRVPQAPALLRSSQSRWWRLTGGDRTSFLALTVPLLRGGRPAGTFVVVAEETRTAATWRTLLTTAAAAGAIGLVLAAVLAFVMMRRALRPLSRISGQVAAIQASGDLSRRVAEDGPNDEVGRLAAGFNRMLGRLDDTVRSQRRFVADASHELRTPLTVAKGRLELAAGEPDPGEVREALAVADTELDRMARIVQELLLLAKLDEGLPLASEPVEVELIAQEALLRGLRTARREATVHVDPDLFVPADRDRLLQVLSNLVTNAVQHAGADARIALRAARRADGLVAIEVHDDGTGIAPADLPHVFDRFYRSRTEPGGAGLGLAIAASIVRAMGGRITVASTPREGTTFTVLLPSAR
ncbi:MAG TPA: ATP-binding protein [Streptosporangiaceae bacterium]|nr:ATP-binding protein [Streptosporangiaceae bacterium]